jgi:hypothetical protein
MQRASHLTEEQFARFQDRTLEAPDLMAVDEHLAACGECRQRLEREQHAIEQIAALHARISHHLTYEQVVACADGAEDRHLAECAACRDEVADLRKFRSELRSAPRTMVEMPARKSGRRIPAWAAIAAGLLLAGGLTFSLLHREPSVAELPKVARVAPPAEPALAPEQQAAVQLALTSHALERAPVLNRLISKRGVLLGAPGKQRAFAIDSPMGTVVLNDRPVFRWEAVTGATTYVVAVFDERFQKVAESPALTTAEWTPEQPLARGQLFNWQVTAHVGGRKLRSPVPPAPEARFQVAAAEDALRVETARRDHPGNHLLLAVLLARDGALDDAAHELDALSATDAATAQPLRESLKAIRAH